MSGAALGLLDRDRNATVFLPAISFGFVYANFSTLTPCFLFTRGCLGYIPRYWLLVAAVVSSVIAAALFAGISEFQEIMEEVGGWKSVIAGGFTTVHILFWVSSALVLLSRICHGNAVIVGLSLLYIVMITMAITEYLLQ